MSTSVQSLPISIPSTPSDSLGIAGHPAGLTTLFFTEFWERFSYYGMRALLVLYMTAPALNGGLAFPVEKAAQIYGLYTASVYITAVLGGAIADNLLGARRSVFLGGIIIALGHFLMAFPTLACFFGGMVLISLGTGLLKPNISAMVGKLYGPDDPRRDGGFSIFYIGINLGGMLAPLVCGTIGQRVNWHLGFALAGVGMVMGLFQFLWHRERLGDIGMPPARRTSTENKATPQPALTDEDTRRLASIFVLFAFSSLFWALFEQSGSSLSLFAQNQTANQVFGWEFPSTWFQSVNSFFILLLAPVFSILWVKWGTRQPTSMGKFSIGLFFVGFGYLALLIGTCFSENKVSPLWLVGLYFLHTIGELCISPVGLGTVTRVAPVKMVGVLMGLWFVFTAIGNYCAGLIATYFNPAKGWASLQLFFGVLAVASVVGGILLAALTPVVQRMTRLKV